MAGQESEISRNFPYFDSPLAPFFIFLDPAFSKSAIHNIFPSGTVTGTGMGVPPAMMINSKGNSYPAP
jgi:hypothetical protein